MNSNYYFDIIKLLYCSFSVLDMLFRQHFVNNNELCNDRSVGYMRNMTYKTKDRVTRTLLKTIGDITLGLSRVLVAQSLVFYGVFCRQ
jgi:hypothetical protein